MNPREEPIITGLIKCLEDIKRELDAQKKLVLNKKKAQDLLTENLNTFTVLIDRFKIQKEKFISGSQFYYKKLEQSIEIIIASCIENKISFQYQEELTRLLTNCKEFLPAEEKKSIAPRSHKR